MKGTEYQEQCKVFEWSKLLESKYPMLKFLHSTQNGMRTNLLTAVNAKRAGMKRGVLDIDLPYNNGKYYGLHIELKVGKNKPTSEQKAFIEWLNKNGRYAVVCYGFKEAAGVIEKYVKNEI